MLLDLLDQVMSAPQAVTAAAYSTGSKDKGLAALDYASGKVIYGMAMVTTTLTDGGANTGTQVYWADDTAGASLGTTFGTGAPVSLQLLGTFPQAAAVGVTVYVAFAIALLLFVSTWLITEVGFTEF